MRQRDLVRVSKRLSLHLRHAPERIGIRLGAGGWVDVAELLAALREHGLDLTHAELDEVVARNDKQRFAFDSTGSRIRANQGHSVPVDLALPVVKPPELLYHGTVERYLSEIMRSGLRPMRRHVHLSATAETAATVGARRGEPVVLEVAAGSMVTAGYEFRLSGNGVWLTDHVPPAFLRGL